MTKLNIPGPKSGKPKTEPLTLRVEQADLEILQKYCEATGESRTRVIKQALQEFIFGYMLNPTDPQIAFNLMKLLAALNLFPLVIEIWQHYQENRNPEYDVELYPIMEKLVDLSKICTMGLLGWSDSITENDISESVASVFDSLEISQRPWFNNVEE